MVWQRFVGSDQVGGVTDCFAHMNEFSGWRGQLYLPTTCSAK